MKTQTPREKLASNASGQVSPWIEDAKWRRANRDWLKVSSQIAIRILSTLKEQGLTQKDLAQKINVSPQQISKIVKGKENLSLQTIIKLEKALNVSLIVFPQYEQSNYKEQREYSQTLPYKPKLYLVADCDDSSGFQSIKKGA